MRDRDNERKDLGHIVNINSIFGWVRDTLVWQAMSDFLIISIFFFHITTRAQSQSRSHRTRHKGELRRFNDS